MARLEVILLVVLLVLLPASPTALAQATPGLPSPTYAEGDFWDYQVGMRLDALTGIGDVSGLVEAEGRARAEVTAVVEDEATLTWSGTLDLQGRVALPGETAEAAVSGTIETTYVEHRQEPQFLPIAFDAQTTFDVLVTFVVVVPYTATMGVNATIRPGPSSPMYPLEAGDRTFTMDATVASNVTTEFLGMELENATLEQMASTIRWNATPFETVQVPAGSFSGLRVQMEALAGFVPSPLPALIPGGVVVTHHSPTVGNPILFRFFGNDTEVGNASLETFSYAPSVPTPFWQNPLFIGGLLAIPIALLLYRYWRERRKGL